LELKQGHYGEVPSVIEAIFQKACELAGGGS
jgi:hypothetical protein